MKKFAGFISTSYLDATFGRGGHFENIVAAPQVARAVGFDRDEQAILHAQENYPLDSGRFQFFCERFSKFDPTLHGNFDFILVDLGVSSPQLEDPARGFSFYHQGPLDMRMGQSQEYTAADVINTFRAEELIEIFQKYGEIYQPYRLVDSIIEKRRTEPFLMTQDLALFMEKIWGWRKKGNIPQLTSFEPSDFSSIRNLKMSKTGIPKLMAGLRPKGRLAVLTFQSLEDRLVKELFSRTKRWEQS